MDDWTALTALTAAINLLRDSAESRRMPCGTALDLESIALHLDAAEHLEAMRRALLINSA